MSGNGRFRYPLQPILLTRQWDLDALLSDLASIRQSIAILQRDLQKLQNQGAALAAGWKRESEIRNDMNVDQFVTAARFMHDLSMKIRSIRNSVEEWQKKEISLLDSIMRAKRGIDAVEHHRDELRAEFFKSKSKEQFKALDDHWAILQERKDADAGEH